ncbi:MAG: hypothetical protein K8F25_19100, partial [Fimbriimonadaceae bacterium]|nr:hypothetical protein [Alphaproteobacteria bacterium]
TKGTGLGLAIVSKIAEEHGGTISLHDAPQVASGGHGAVVRISFPKHEPADRGDGEKDGTSEPLNRDQAQPAQV